MRTAHLAMSGIDDISSVMSVLSEPCDNAGELVDYYYGGQDYGTAGNGIPFALPAGLYNTGGQ